MRVLLILVWRIHFFPDVSPNHSDAKAVLIFNNDLREAGSFLNSKGPSAIQGIPQLSMNGKFIKLFSRSRHWVLFCTR